ncbi:DUF4296 domain-containing protein [uncultured Flavobacterium sp.]|uniref:DUF4296 domain-containing protein n=1 Tax=uncultured Flavobacterium sp. TaxID=165435 RepID=UPI0025DAC1E5|nr:DUF4296 domain-containing protein [uncultured Flavobacterium sp.]
MKNFFLFFIGFSFLVSCGQKAIEKPDNLIEKEKMDDIIYDLTLLQAMRGGYQATLDSNKVDVANYIYKKYKIDSLQFANSNRYYASDVAAYNRMFNRVNERLIANKVKADTLAKREEKLNLKKSSDTLNKKPRINK